MASAGSHTRLRSKPADPLSTRVLRTTAAFGKERRAWLWHMLGSLCGMPATGYYFVAYAYGKWIDDRIDDPAADVAASTRFLDRQQEVTDGACAPACAGEMLGSRLGRFFRSPGGSPLCEAWRGLFQTFRVDLERRGRPIGAADLNALIEQLGGSVLDLAAISLGQSGGLCRTVRRDASRVYIGVDMMLDLGPDLRAGTINIPREDFTKHDIPLAVTLRADMATLRDHPGFRRWVSGRIAELADAHARARRLARSIRPRLVGWCLRLLLADRGAKLARLRRRWPEVERGGGA